MQVSDFTKHIVEGLLGEDAKKKIATFAGSFRPPTKSDYNLLLKALEDNPGLDEIHVFVGDSESEGLDQDDAVAIWRMFGEHFPRDFYVHKSEQSPVSDVYAYANKFPTYDIDWLFGVREGNSDDFKQVADRTKSVNKYENVNIRPVVYDKKATEREVGAAANMGKDELAKYMPNNLTYKELDDIYNMLQPKQLQEVADEDLGRFEDVINKIIEEGWEYFDLADFQAKEFLLKKQSKIENKKLFTTDTDGGSLKIFWADRGDLKDYDNFLRVTGQDVQDIIDAGKLNLNEVADEDLGKFEEAITKVVDEGFKFYAMLSPRFHGSKVVDFLKGEEARVNKPQFAIQDFKNGIVLIFSDGTRFVLGEATDQDIQDLKDAGDANKLNEAKNLSRFEDLLNKIAGGDYYYVPAEDLDDIGRLEMRQVRVDYGFDLDKPMFSFTIRESDIGARFSDEPENEFWIQDATEQEIQDLRDTVKMFTSEIPIERLKEGLEPSSEPVYEMLHTVSGKELKKGIAVEMEHTDDPKVAKKIALDHLAEDPKYYTKLASLGLEENNDPNGEMERYQQIMDFMSDNGLKLDPKPAINIIDNDHENAKDFFGVTAYYEPNDNIVVLYTAGRHPKDVARSFAHELVHCHQRNEGRLGDISTTNTNEDGHLEELEREAYETGNIMFRKWSDSIKNGAIQESVRDNKIICDNCGWSWDIDDGGDDMFTCHKCGSDDNMPIVKEKKQIGKDEFAAELARLRENRENLSKNKQTINKIYCDINEVLADTDTPDLDWTDDGRKLWEYLFMIPKPVTLLSSTTNQQHKEQWIDSAFDPRLKPKVIFRRSYDKHEFSEPGSLLIDNKEETIDSWREKGGIGILHKNADDTIKQLQNLGI